MSTEIPTQGQTGKKSLIINAFVESCRCLALLDKIVSTPSVHNGNGFDAYLRSGHQSPGLWGHPDDQSHRFNDVDHLIDLAKLLERGKLHGIFIADVLGQ